MLNTNGNSSTNMRVVVRVRPFSTRELEQNQRNIISVTDETTLIFDPEEDEDEFFFHGNKQSHRDITKRVNKKLLMDFDDVFNDQSTNSDVFETCMKPLVTEVMNGFSCSVFVYGATGAGKTHTMLGNSSERGITFMTMEYLFSQMDLLENERKFDIGISYLEVYNEQVMNLLTKTGPLRLREDGSGGVVVNGLCLKPITSAVELLDLLALGNLNRTQHPTDANAESSRSHAIFQVHIRMTNKLNNQKNLVKLSMIDLAGSERAASTKCIGQRFKEGASINKSLLALGNCINKLADGSKHIPYRDSNLTRIIKDCLGGNCRTVMIANVSPSSLTYDDTYNTLKYAGRARKIKTTLSINMVKSNVPKEILVKQLNGKLDENVRLLATIEELKKKITSMENRPTQLVSPIDLSQWHNDIDTVYDSIKVAFEHCYNLISKERILKLRTKFKEEADMCSRLLALDQSNGGQNLRVEASIDRMSKQIHVQQDESKLWKNRLKNHQQELFDLHKKIRTSNMSHLLEKYIRAKELDVENVKLKQKAAHFMKISSLHMRENDISHKIMNASNSFNRTSYLLMRANNITHQDMHTEYENLIKMNQRQGAVKFNENEAESDEAFAHLTIPLYEMKSPQNALKREHSDDGSEFQGEFRRPSRKLFKTDSNQPVASMASKTTNLNETLVLSTVPSGSTNLPVVRPLVKSKVSTKCRPVPQMNRNKENSSTLAVIKPSIHSNLKMKSPKRSPRLLNNNANKKPYTKSSTLDLPKLRFK
ncbi:hypothetical protein HA402_003060 [Bradysia odoriphaga]|nr:hypothetical protein HA402_003060 [Bradysia odoriphaga]